MADIKSILVNGNLTVNNDVSIGGNLTVSGLITGDNTFTGVNLFKAPTNSNGTEQITTKFLTSNGGSIKIGKEGQNSGTMLRFDQVDGTCRLRFRASATAGAMVWEQPETNASLYFDMGTSSGSKARITLRNVEGTLALTKELPPTVTANPTGTSTAELTSIKVGSTIYSIPAGSTASGDVTAAGDNTFTGTNIFREKITVQPAASTDTYCIIEPTGVFRIYDSTTSLARISILSGNRLSFTNSDGEITRYQPNKIEYGFSSNNASSTLKFPYYDSTLPAQAIATTTDLVRSADPSYMSIVYKGINFNFSNFKGGSTADTVIVNWGDGTMSSVTATNTVPTHQYAEANGEEDMYLITVEPASKFCTTLPESSFAGSSSDIPGIYSFNAGTGITSIGDNAFSDCENLRNVELLSVTSIGAYAFSHCKNLTEINLPNTRSIGKYAFQHCSILTNINIPICANLDVGAFSNCTKLEKIILPYNLKVIPDDCFYNNLSLREVLIPEGITSIGSSAFQYTSSLYEITIPKSVTSIGSSAFNFSVLRKIIIKNTESVIPYTTNMLYSNYIEQIVVPYSLLSQYKAASGWSAFANKIVADITSDDISSLFTYSGNTLTINI